MATTSEILVNKLSKALKELLTWVKPDSPVTNPLTVQQAMLLTDRDSFSELLSYKDIDEENGLIFLDDGKEPAIGFCFRINPLLGAGHTAVQQIESIINMAPADTVMQSAVISTPQVRDFLDTWAFSRIKGTQDRLLRELTLKRREFMLTTAVGPSLCDKQTMHPRDIRYYMSFRIPYKGFADDMYALKRFLKSVLDFRKTVDGCLSGGSMGPRKVTGHEFKNLLREMLNPNLTAEERNQQTDGDFQSITRLMIDKRTRISVQDDGAIGFSSGMREEPDVVCSAITVDTYPQELYITEFAKLIGNPSSFTDRIFQPFFAYTNIHILDRDKSLDSLTSKFAVLNKQTMSESEWYRSMMRHLFERKEDTASLLHSLKEKGKRAIRMYSGINLYSAPDDAKNAVENTVALWKKIGMNATVETYISFPVFIASLPLQYTPAMDPPNRGLQRAHLCNSVNGASACFIQGDCSGTSPDFDRTAESTPKFYGAGPLLVSRRGQLASFDLFQCATNYNFIIVATSGAGKSYFANEIILDFLTKGGLVRIIDKGGSFKRITHMVQGTNILFDVNNPRSLNPFWGLKTIEDLSEMMAVLVEVLRYMAYPLTKDEDIPSWEYAHIKEAIVNTWKEYKDITELKHVYEWLMSFEPEMSDIQSDYEHQKQTSRALAYQLKEFAYGRHAMWFNGPRELDLGNRLVLLELDGLDQDVELRTLVLTLLMAQIAKDVYLSSRKIPKLVLIDEAWDLFGEMKAGKFIEKTFRTIRKYNGTAGVITQGYADFHKSEATKAIQANAGWTFTLKQKDESITYAAEHKMITSDENFIQMLRSINSLQDNFSEVYVKNDDGVSGVYRLILDRHSHYLASSKAADSTRIDDLIAGGMDILAAIDHCAVHDYKKMWASYYLDDHHIPDPRLQEESTAD